MQQKNHYLCGVKWLSLIFCLYVTILLAYPCQDNGICDSADNHTAQDCGRHHEQDNNECHHCTPLCACNCCQIVALTSLHIMTGSISELPLPIETLYQKMLTEGMPDSVWQPPKA